MRVLVRSWNVFHGNAEPPERRDFLEEMVRLASADRPEVLCLQEVPVWAGERLPDWSGMQALVDVAARPSIGPLPIPVELGRRLTDLHHGLLRSAFSGQANAVLLAPNLRPVERRTLVLNSRRFRAEQARRLELDALTRLAWAKERRICQAVRISLPDGPTALVANLHATSPTADERLPDAELLRAAVFADALAGVGEAVVLAGDFNATRSCSRTLEELSRPEWGFSAAGAGLDHILVRGAPAGPLETWPDERRCQKGRVLSDHAPVELAIE